MAQIVFVHGVSTRKDAGYQSAVEARDRRFLDVAFKGATADLTIANPYWGEFGTQTGDLLSIPDMSAQFQALGLGGGPDAFVKSERAILDAAKIDFAAVVGALSVASITTAQMLGQQENLRKAEALSAGAAAYAEDVPRPSWLAEVDSDDQFLARLTEEAEATAEIETLGLFDGFKEAADQIAGGLSNIVNGPIAKIGREILTPKIAIFVGDVFRYLKGAGGREPIRKVVMDAIVAAAKKDGKLILIGHSMGGVILYDLLSDQQTVSDLSTAIGRPFKADLLLTVGAQVALFEEMKLYVSSDPAGIGFVNRPLCAERWWNVFDRMDILSFITEPVFKGVTDFSADTTAGVADAHGAYFSSMVFYTRLNRRLHEAALI